MCEDDPVVLFDLFSKGFGLPVAWPLSHQGFYSGGGIVFGNIQVDVIRFRSPTSMARTHFFGLAFKPASLNEALDELARRGISHGSPQPFAGAEIVGWTNVMLGGLLGRRSRTFTLGR